MSHALLRLHAAADEQHDPPNLTPSRLRHLLSALVGWSIALHRVLRGEIPTLARLAKEEEPPVKAIANLLLFAAASEGTLDTVALAIMQPAPMPLGGAAPVARLLRWLESRTDGKQPATIALLAQLCRGDATAMPTTDAPQAATAHTPRCWRGWPEAIGPSLHRAVDREAQRAVLAQLLAQPLRAEALLLSFIDSGSTPRGSGAAASSSEAAARAGGVGASDAAPPPLPSLALAWQGMPSPQLAFGRTAVPLEELAPAADTPMPASTYDDANDQIGAASAAAACCH